MFLYECQSNKGAILGTCMDGILFGVCCQTKATDDDAVENKLDEPLPLSKANQTLDPLSMVDSILNEYKNSTR